MLAGFLQYVRWTSDTMRYTPFSQHSSKAMWQEEETLHFILHSSTFLCRRHESWSCDMFDKWDLYLEKQTIHGLTRNMRKIRLICSSIVSVIINHELRPPITNNYNGSTVCETIYELSCWLLWCHNCIATFDHARALCPVCASWYAHVCWYHEISFHFMSIKAVVNWFHGALLLSWGRNLKLPFYIESATRLVGVTRYRIVDMGEFSGWFVGCIKSLLIHAISVLSSC